jgi:hypothetical protein
MEGAFMVARRLQRFASEDWSGHWGTDARYYARRSDGALFVIDGAVTVFDLAHSAPPASMAQRVSAMPDVGGYTLRVVAARPEPGPGAVDETRASVERGGSSAQRRRLVVCGTRRPTRG